MKRTMRIRIGTSLYCRLIEAVESGRTWGLEDKIYNIINASRIDGTDYVRVELEQVVIK